MTPKNLDVLTDFLKKRALRRNGEVRRVILSEQGFHSQKSTDGERIQAAAYCFAYRLIASNPGIDAFILHRHIDHPREGGLNLGLWQDAGEDAERRKGSQRGRERLQKKMIYECFREADGDRWEDVFQFALPIVGVESWPTRPREGNGVFTN